MSKLLIDEYPLMVLPTLAKNIGLNEAIFVQQLHFLIDTKEKNNDLSTYRDGYMWVFNSVNDWHENYFYFWSKRTLERVIAKCEEKGYIISTNKYNKYKYDKTKWYRLNYDVINEIAQKTEKEFRQRLEKRRKKASETVDNSDTDKMEDGYRQSVEMNNNKGNSDTDKLSVIKTGQNDGTGNDKTDIQVTQNVDKDSGNLDEPIPETTTYTTTYTSTEEKNLDVINNYNKLWKKILEKIKSKLSAPSFKTWFSDTSIKEINGDTVIINTPSAFVSDWLYNRYHALILDLLYEEIGKKIRIKFYPEG